MQIFVYGDSLQAYLVGVVYPNPDSVKAFITKHNLDANTSIKDVVTR